MGECEQFVGCTAACVSERVDWLGTGVRAPPIDRINSQHKAREKMSTIWRSRVINKKMEPEQQKVIQED